MHKTMVLFATLLTFAATTASAQVKVMPGDNTNICQKGDCGPGKIKTGPVKPTALIPIQVHEGNDEIAVLIGDDLIVDLRSDVLRVVSVTDQVAFELPAAGTGAPVTIAGGASTAIYTNDFGHAIFDARPGKGLIDTWPTHFGLFDTNPRQGIVGGTPIEKLFDTDPRSGIVIDITGAGVIIGKGGQEVVIDVGSAGLTVKRTSLGGKTGTVFHSSAITFTPMAMKGSSIATLPLKSWLTKISMPTLIKDGKTTGISYPTLGLTKISMPTLLKISMPTLAKVGKTTGISMPTLCLTGISYPTLNKSLETKISMPTLCTTGISYPTLVVTRISMPTLQRVTSTNPGATIAIRDSNIGALGITVGDELPSGISGTTTDLITLKSSFGKITIGTGDVALRSAGSHIETFVHGSQKTSKVAVKGAGSSFVLTNTVINELKNFSLITKIHKIDSLVGQLFDYGTIKTQITMEAGKMSNQK